MALVLVPLDAAGNVDVAPNRNPTLIFLQDSDARVATYQALKPIQAIYLAKVLAGIAITSSGTPSLSATYAVDQQTLSDVSGLVLNGFPHNAATFQYPDITGTPHPPGFTPAQMTALRNAMRDYVNDIETQYQIELAGGTPTWPPNTATIP